MSLTCMIDKSEFDLLTLEFLKIPKLQKLLQREKSTGQEQGHHHNVAQTVRRPQISYVLCSICFYSFEVLAKAVRLFIASLHNL